jgi:hypothetical protein
MVDRFKLFREAFQTATMLDGLMLVTIDDVTKTRVEHWSGKVPSFAENLRTWGEAGTVKIKTTMTPKIADRGIQCMFVGYAPDHAGDVYRMWDRGTNRVHTTRDVIWLKRMFYERPSNNGEVATAVEIIDSGQDINDDEGFTIIEAEEGEIPGANDVIETVETADDVEVFEIIDDDNLAADHGVTMETRSGRTVTKPTRLIEEIGAAANNIGLSKAETNVVLQDAC